MAREVEILVHIAAPSTAKDDALYRTFASAHVDFKPARRIDFPAAETNTALTPAKLPLAELCSPQASFNSVWDNIRPPPAHLQTSAQKPDSHNGEGSQTSWVQPPSEIADSMPNNNLAIPEFNSPERILDWYMQAGGGPPVELSEEAGRRDWSSYEGGDDLTTLFAQGTDTILEGAKSVSTDPKEKAVASQCSVYEGGADFTTFLARGTEAIIHDYPPGSLRPVGEPKPSRSTVYEGSAYLNSLNARGTNSILQGDHVPPTPAPGPAAIAELTTSDPPYGTPPNATTSDSRMDESHISQTPSSPLRSKSIPPPASSSSSSTSSKLSRVRSSDPHLTSQQSQSELFGVTIPSTQLPERADSAPSSSKRHKPNPPQKHAHNLSRTTSDVLPPGTTSRASPITRQTILLPPPDPRALATQAVDWSRYMYLNSPDPPPSNHRLEPETTPKLEKLVKDIGNRYQPIFPSSSSPPKMRTYERGYWLLPIADWPHYDKLRAWGFLGNIICRDQEATWGTRACRDNEWTWLRLYGWEHLAGELYLLLYMASYRRLKFLEIAWYDGKGEVLIVVRARAEQRALETSALEWSKTWSEVQA